jgi:hypothetical protein
MSTRQERRRFRQVVHGLYVTDPGWAARHDPRRHRLAELVRLVSALLAVALVAGGAATGTMPLVGCGILLGIGTTTSIVSSRPTAENGAAATDPGVPGDM